MANGKNNGRRGPGGRRDVRKTSSSLSSSGVLKADMTSYMRVGLLGAIAVGVVCFLFYPDLVRLVRTGSAPDDVGRLQKERVKKDLPDQHNTQRRGQDDPSRFQPNDDDIGNDDEEEEIMADDPVDEEEVTDEEFSDEKESDIARKPPTKKLSGDLMMDEEEESEAEVTEESVELFPADPGEALYKEEAKDRMENREREGKTMKMKVVGQDGSGPFKLSGSGGEFKLELEPSEEASDDRPADRKEKNGKTAQETKKNAEKAKTNSKGHTKNPKKTGSKKSTKRKDSKKTSENDSKEDSKSELPKEVRDFKPVILDKVTPKKIFADGRRIPPVELLHQKPSNSSVKVFLFEEFLSKEECDGLRRVHDQHVQDTKHPPLLCFDSISTLKLHLKDARKKVKVTPNDFVSGTKCVNASLSKQLAVWLKGNWSYSTAFYPGESRFSEVFANRVQQAMGLLPGNGGKFQITSYPQGKAYKAHTDCIVDGQDKRDRVASVLVYLDDVEEGGETKFPELGIWVKPRKGRALVWNNMDSQGRCEPDSIHEASKVINGSKYILIRWYYYQSFYSLGKRPPEPPLPTRPAGTPRVSCDEYDHGSCRWYDEWNFDHLIEYERRKFTLI